MEKLLVVMLLMLLSCGCARNHFNVPEQNFAERVKVLGVVPIMVDADSDIRYPEKEQLLALVKEMNRTYEQQLIRSIKGTGSFYTVALLDSDPVGTYASLLGRRERRDDATILYNKYFWKGPELAELIRKNNLDAVMLVVVSGLTKNERIYSSTLLSSLASDYNYLIMTAQIVDKEGTILWEYPNFRSRVLKYPPLIGLQYPDFDEAVANLAKEPNIKFKTLEGIRRRLDEKRKDYLLRDTREPDAYGTQFDEMVGYLGFEPAKQKQPAAAPVPAEQPRPVAAQAAPVVAPTVAPAAAPAPAPVAPAPLEKLQPSAVPEPVSAGRPASDEIVPATGGAPIQ